MPKIYLFVVFGAIVASVYFAAVIITREKCRAENALSENQKIQTVITTKKEINEKVFNTGTNDIRNILRTKYTIRD